MRLGKIEGKLSRNPRGGDRSRRLSKILRFQISIWGGVVNALAARSQRRNAPMQPAGSAKADRFQIIVGLNDLTQAIFRGAVAIVGIGMMPLHQGLELGLDLGRRGFVLDAKRVACLALGIVHNPRFTPAGLFALGAGATMTEQAERLGGCPGSE